MKCAIFLSMGTLFLSVLDVSSFNSYLKVRSTLKMFKGQSQSAGYKSDKRLKCVGTDVSPLPQPEGGARKDSDNSWRTEASSIIPIDAKVKERPEVITFSAYDTLIEPSQSVGRWLREVLNTKCDMRIRLPRPALFTVAFHEAFSAMSKRNPCYGARSALSSREWWFEVVQNTYQNTKDLNQVSKEELETLMPDVFEMLYVDIFSTAKGWSLKDDVTYTLEKLTNWRELGQGPKIGVIANFDENLLPILTELGIADKFDFVLTSYESGYEKPERGIFDKALQLSACLNPNAAYHVGKSLSSDIAGAVAAGWTAFRFNQWFDNDFPDWNNIDTFDSASKGAELQQSFYRWGRLDTNSGLEWIELWGLDDVLTLFGFPEDDKKPVKTTYIRAVFDD